MCTILFFVFKVAQALEKYIALENSIAKNEKDNVDFEKGESLRNILLIFVKRVTIFIYTQGTLEKKCNPCIRIKP
jgi:hypothetical protein